MARQRWTLLEIPLIFVNDQFVFKLMCCNYMVKWNFRDFAQHFVELVLFLHYFLLSFILNLWSCFNVDWDFIFLTVSDWSLLLRLLSSLNLFLGFLDRRINRVGALELVERQWLDHLLWRWVSFLKKQVVCLLVFWWDGLHLDFFFWLIFLLD